MRWIGWLISRGEQWLRIELRGKPLYVGGGKGERAELALRADLDARKTTSVELVEAFTRRIEAIDRNGPHVRHVGWAGRSGNGGTTIAAACWIPARRASRVSPSEPLRAE